MGLKVFAAALTSSLVLLACFPAILHQFSDYSIPSYHFPVPTQTGTSQHVPSETSSPQPSHSGSVSGSLLQLASVTSNAGDDGSTAEAGKAPETAGSQQGGGQVGPHTAAQSQTAAAAAAAPAAAATTVQKAAGTQQKQQQQQPPHRKFIAEKTPGSSEAATTRAAAATPAAAAGAAGGANSGAGAAPSGGTAAGGINNNGFKTLTAQKLYTHSAVLVENQNETNHDANVPRRAPTGRINVIQDNHMVYTSAFGGSIPDEKSEEVDKKVPMNVLPPDFNWAAYLALNPDLPQGGILSETQAVQHFMKNGRQEHRVYRPRYSAADATQRHKVKKKQ